MRIFSVVGVSLSGKTTTIENIIKELNRRGYTVATVKEIHYENFSIDTEGSNTYRHKMAGSQLVTARGLHETDIMFNERLPMKKIIPFYEDKYDYLILEGVRDANVPTIICAKEDEDAKIKWSEWTFCVSGILADKCDSYNDVPAISSLKNIGALVDLIEKTTYDRLPDFPKKCCSLCGLSCKELGLEITKGHKKRTDCVLENANISVKLDGKELPMIPFIQRIVKSSVLSVIKELDGYTDDKEIEIKINSRL